MRGLGFRVVGLRAATMGCPFRHGVLGNRNRDSRRGGA